MFSLTNEKIKSTTEQKLVYSKLLLLKPWFGTVLRLFFAANDSLMFYLFNYSNVFFFNIYFLL